MSATKPGATILASAISKTYVPEITAKVEQLRAVRPAGPLLVGFLANEDPAAEMYASWTKKTCEAMGFRYELRKVDDRDLLEEAIIEANMDEGVDGILVYFPVFGNAQDQYLQQVVAREKDVEGLNHVYYQNLYHNVRYLDDRQELKSILPCTPLAVVKIMEYLKVYNQLLPEGNRLYGKKCVIVNRSEIVGRPLAALLANDGATVYSVDVENIQEFTRGEGLKFSKHHVRDIGAYSEELLAQYCKDADVIITGVPSASYKFPTDCIKDGAVCINFSSHSNFDDSVKTRASLYVPSTGKVTISMLLRNMLRLIDNREKLKTLR
ncbi:ADR214Wp [Eremothecium gossypii ATCC 10895]|uniref:Methylenetetrahydrofolate dehydrogenase [NAD(+)] n=1 Tax=Eremothecium gossypii (strain ATCC 10895 / CBS 109.51 / FGSC 9923 / NRRL Y-1056) TaxID=284811 RepID=Q759Q9_EREGS|nr:ADR214Wp [Eremothecium gossypii ATCC 10895]AAS52134.1 ADR214Wp [Eremothecium gossypii ATCC 10895]AEY96433.1 FADR214Wp [Eremothecium gossypii FDAG1]